MHSNMGIKIDVEDNLKDFPVTKIDWQPIDEDLNKLKSELSEMTAFVPTTNWGGSHGYMGMITEDAFYQMLLMGRAPFIVPTHPGAYPMTVDSDAVIREQQKI